MKYSVLFAALLALAVTACDKKPEAAPPAAVEQSAPAATAPANQSAATAPADQSAAPAEQSAAPADQSAAPAATSSASMPAECDAYFKTVTACVDKMGAAGEQFKQAMEQSKSQWASMSDSAALAAACKQASDAFATSAKAMGC